MRGFTSTPITDYSAICSGAKGKADTDDAIADQLSCSAGSAPLCSPAARRIALRFSVRLQVDREDQIQPDPRELYGQSLVSTILQELSC